MATVEDVDAETPATLPCAHRQTRMFREWVAVPLLLSICALGAFLFDIPVSRVLWEHRHIHILADFFSVAETFGHGYGVAMLVLAVWAFDRTAKKRIHWILAGSLGAGLVANIFKMGVVRARPFSCDLLTTTAFETFGNFLPFMSVGMDGQSFPSAHSASAVGFAIVLSIYYPQSRWFVTFAAAATCLSRAVVLAHFASDVFAGSAIGWMVGQLATRQPLVPALIKPFIPGLCHSSSEQAASRERIVGNIDLPTTNSSEAA